MACLRPLAVLIAIPALTLLASNAFAQDNARATQRPKVCLVLSGGGARGAAHVGVIKVLEELRVPVDCIAGTSMGALVGAAYASGSTVRDMEALISGISAEALFIEKPPRQEQSIRRKEEDLANLVGPEFGLRDGALLWSKGFVSGVQLETILRRLAGAHGAIRIEELPIQYRAVATDLETGKPVVFREGELLNAMRASMSVPAAIAPAEIDGRMLVDGGLTDNLPVDVARAMDAEIVIAVNLGTPLFKRKALGSVLGVTGQMVNILTEQNVQASLASLKSTDILIEPELEDFSFSDFGRLPAAVPIGEAAARKVGDRLLALAVSPTEFAAWRRQQRTDVLPDTRAVDEIRVTGLQRAGDGRVIHYAGFKQLLHRGPVEEISLAEFLDGHELRVQAAVDAQFGPAAVVARARSRVGEDSYRVWSNKCEHFATWCSTGVARSRQAEVWAGWIGKAAQMIARLRGQQRRALGRLQQAVAGPRHFAGAA